MKSRWKLPIFAGMLLGFGLGATQVHGQDYVYATGNPNFGVNYPIPGGYINVTNGNVHITIPLGTFKQRGNLPPVKVNLEYDSRIWKIIDNGGYSWQPVNVPNSMAGWRITTGLEQGTTSYYEFPITGPYVCNGKAIQTTLANDYTAFNWTDGQGTKHMFDVSLRQNIPNPCSPGGSLFPVSGSGYAIDGSGYYLQVVNNYVMTIYDNAGNEVYPVREDPNGNTITVNSSGEPVDVQGHTLLTTTTNGSTIQYQVPKEGGGTNTFTVTTGQISVSTAFNQSDVSENSTPLTAIQSIELPDGSTYSFTYDSGTNGNYGEMIGMTLPGGGNVAFYYANYLDSYNNENRWINEENDNNEYTSFAPKVLSQCGSQPTGCQEQMTVSGGFAGSRVYTLTLNDGAWNGVTQTYAGAPQTSPLLLTVANNYNFQSYQCANNYICNGAEYITASSSTATLNDVSPNLTSTTCYTYASPWIGKTSKIQEWDYQSSPVSCASPPTPNRETDYAYNYAIHGASLVTQKSKNFNGQQFASTAYSYSNGSMTSKTEGISGGAQSTTQYGYNADGSRKSKTDPNGNVTSYAYNCGDVYLSQTTYPVTGGVSHVTSANPDCYTGQPVSTTDQNGLITTYGYDGYGRKLSISYPDGGETSYSYPSSTQMVETRKLDANTSSVLTTVYDGYGRKSQTEQSDPAGDDIVAYTYAYPNLPGCVSAPYRGTSNGDTCPSYDALDRPTQITQPDGNKIAVSYTGNQATVTDENGHQKRYVYDAFHDLTQVFEPNSSGTPSWETDYSYDAAGRVLSITQKGDGSSAARVRSFSYDDLGRLTSESTPEGGAKSYSYDADGNLTSESSSRGTTTYSYDALNRMTGKSGSVFSYNYYYDQSAATT